MGEVVTFYDLLSHLQLIRAECNRFEEKLRVFNAQFNNGLDST